MAGPWQMPKLLGLLAQLQLLLYCSAIKLAAFVAPQCYDSLSVKPSMRPDMPKDAWASMQIAHEDALQLEPWMSWAQAYADLLLRCAARWARGRATGAAQADALPCIRLLPDSYFTKHLDEVHTPVPSHVSDPVNLASD